MREKLQILSTIALGAIAIFFTVGLLIVNIYLSTYGVYYIDFIRADYILVGAIYIFLIILGRLSSLYGGRRIKQAIEKLHQKKWWLAVKDSSIGLFWVASPLIGAFVILAQYHLGWLYSWRMWFALFMIISFGKYINDFLFSLISFCIWLVSSESKIDERDFVLESHSLISAIVFILSNIAVYSYCAYPYIISGLGGGYKDPVILVPSVRGREVFPNLAVPMLDGGKYYGPFKLITETDTDIVVAPISDDSAKFHSMRLNQSLFDAVLTGLPSK